MEGVNQWANEINSLRHSDGRKLPDFNRSHRFHRYSSEAKMVPDSSSTTETVGQTPPNCGLDGQAGTASDNLENLPLLSRQHCNISATTRQGNNWPSEDASDSKSLHPARSYSESQPAVDAPGMLVRLAASAARPTSLCLEGYSALYAGAWQINRSCCRVAKIGAWLRP